MTDLNVQVCFPPSTFRIAFFVVWDSEPAYVLVVDFRWCFIIFFTDCKNTNHFAPLKNIFCVKYLYRHLFDKYLYVFVIFTPDSQMKIFMSQSLTERYSEIQVRIREACKKAGRDPDEILLVAVSKTKPDEDVLDLREIGHLHFGENRVKALEKRMEEIPDPSIVWHFIGNLQTNKIKYMAGRADWIHSVHKKKALKEIEKRAGEGGRTIHALIQVNISGEKQKGGCEPDQLEGILKYAQSLKYTNVLGLMGMATYADDPESVRPEFQLLSRLRQEHKHLSSGAVDLRHLSMGMTNDLEVAIQEGATIVRIGTAIFGERNY